MSRLWRIAAREYIAYVRTVGFWLSLLVLPLAMSIGGVGPMLVERNSPTPTLAVVDLTGENLRAAVIDSLLDGDRQAMGAALRGAALAGAGPAAGDAVRDAFDKGGEAAAKAKLAEVAPRVAAAFKPPKAKLRVVDTPQAAAAAKTPTEAGAALKPLVNRDVLDNAAVLSGAGDHVSVDVWTRNVADNDVERQVRDAVADQMRARRLAAAGVSEEALKAADALKPTVSTYSPKAAAGKVSLKDRLPSLVGFGLGMLLWMVVMTGAGILLNSTIEEKSTKILEVLLASASVPEIMGGKILGVALVTATVLGLWLTIGWVALMQFSPGMARDLLAILFGHGLFLYFALYVVGGYLMYAALFAALGAFCETNRDAQTLVGPLMVFLSVPIIFMSQAIRHPDAHMLQTLSWIPPFTPFLMAARAASGPPWWEIAGTATLMLATTAVVLWISGRAFRAGALSTGKVDLKTVVAKLTGRAS